MRFPAVCVIYIVLFARLTADWGVSAAEPPVVERVFVTSEHRMEVPAAFKADAGHLYLGTLYGSALSPDGIKLRKMRETNVLWTVSSADSRWFGDVASGHGGDVYFTLSSEGRDLSIGNYQYSGTTAPEALIARADSNGVVQWIQPIGTTFTGRSGAGNKDLAVISDGMAVGLTTATRGVVAGFNHEGERTFLLEIDSSENDWFMALTSNSDDCLFVAGIVSAGVAQFGSFAWTNSVRTGFVAKINPARSVEWAKPMNIGSVSHVGFGRTPTTATSLVPESDGGVYVSGISSRGGGISFSRLNSKGEVVWSRTFFDSQFAYPTRLSKLPSGNIVMSGSFTEALTLDGLHLIARSSPVAEDFLASFTPSGMTEWAVLMGESARSSPTLHDTDGVGNVFAVGTLTNTVTLGSWSMAADPAPDERDSYSQVYVAKLAPALTNGLPLQISLSGASKAKLHLQGQNGEVQIESTRDLESNLWSREPLNAAEEHDVSVDAQVEFFRARSKP